MVHGDGPQRARTHAAENFVLGRATCRVVQCEGLHQVPSLLDLDALSAVLCQLDGQHSVSSVRQSPDV